MKENTGKNYNLGSFNNKNIKTGSENTTGSWLNNDSNPFLSSNYLKWRPSTFPTNQDISSEFIVKQVNLENAKSITESFYTINSLKEELNKKTQDIKEELNKKTQDITETYNDDIEELRKKVQTIQSEKGTLISIFWVFASIVTFLSIEIQILKAVCDVKVFLWISLTITASLLLFNIFLYILGNEWVNWKDNWEKWYKNFLLIAILIISSILFIVGIVFAYNWDEQKCGEKKYLELEAKIEERVDTIEKNYAKNIKELILTHPNN